MVSKLGAKKVAVFDAQEPYSQGLADTVEAYLKAKGVAVQRLLGHEHTTDFSAIVNKIDKDTDVAFTPFQKSRRTRRRSRSRCASRARRPIVFGTDGTIDPAFKFPGSYVSNFAPDHQPGSRRRRRSSTSGRRPTRAGRSRLFGPPSYGATQVIMAGDQEGVCRRQGH